MRQLIGYQEQLQKESVPRTNLSFPIEYIPQRMRVSGCNWRACDEMVAAAAITSSCSGNECAGEQNLDDEKSM